ncbi:MAG: spermidine/putrescine ABC transporter substrate-binding protein [Chloroflexi bacterium]|nr:spermidine/putrescine ABC transporter substrate-binding protein [Chloroflexota bacterium]NOG66349.1 spermidine/putrescine ABC transporter substrate-binding protein [Chloroflexota bacterium]GIK43565.1 MAG: ABC transporter substrate-binding protein [Chloroflexota bacterium]
MTLRLTLLINLVLFWLVACQAVSPTPTPTPPPLADELIFYNWEEDLPQSVLEAFTRESGVKVNYLVYESQEEAIDNMRAGQVYDVVVMESRFVGLLAREKLLAEINYQHVPNFKNISANFRDLAYDPGNKYSVPYNWGFTALIVRSDLVEAPVTRWADLWDPRYAGRVGLWRGQPREAIALTLKSLGYSASSENPAELAAALDKLLALKPHLRFLEDYDPANAGPALASGEIVIAMGYASDVLMGRELNPAITYVLPQEGALLWGDNFVIPANSPHPYTAELFLNFLQRPEINAQVANENLYATPNEAAYPLINPDLRNNPLVFPSNEDLKKAEIILPLSPEGQKLYDQIWQRFMDAAPPEKR